MTIFDALDAALLPGFKRRMVRSSHGEILTLSAGSGPPVLMLHGDPQTHLCWHKIAPALLDTHTVVLADLPGRGESHKPGATRDHRPYSKRCVAAELVEVMRALDMPQFAVVGHDRGARVARRMALDFPDVVTQLVVMDIVPALDFYELATSDIAQDYYYFFFLTQSHPLTEQMIGGAARDFMAEILTGLGGNVPYDDRALELYLSSASTPGSVVAMCECFRAGVTCDRDDDAADRAAGRRISCPSLVIWGEKGVAGRHFDMQTIWRRWATDVSFLSLDCGHFIPEEAPSETSVALRDFLGAPTCRQRQLIRLPRG